MKMQQARQTFIIIITVSQSIIIIPKIHKEPEHKIESQNKNKRERERESWDQSDGGDKGISSTESVEDPVLPLRGPIDIVPPTSQQSFHVRHGREAQWHSRHS